MNQRTLSFFVMWVVAVVAAAHGCGDDEETNDGDGGSPGPGSTSGPDLTGATCEAPADCYPGVDHATIEGDVLCLDRVRGGYCTHTCTSDDDCCAVPGECEAGLSVVCSPFESTGQKMCFLSCEEEDLFPAPGATGPVDEQEFCQREAGRDFICRSSGGGSENRKVCVPGDCGVGAACIGDGDCGGGLSCMTALDGGYCTKVDCAGDADCPNGSRCVKHVDGKTYCFRSCQTEYDCSFCRGFDLAGGCVSSVEFVDGASGTVCVPP